LIFLIIIPFYNVWVCLLLFTFFAAAYFLSLVDAERRMLYISLQLVAISVMGGFFSLWELVLGFYPALVMGTLPTYRKITWMTGIMGVLFAGAATLYYFRFPEQWNLGWAPILFVLMWLPFLARMRKRSVEMSHRLHDANEEIARLVKNEERQRIARDLHDTLGHTLSSITLKSELVERLIDRAPEQAVREARELQTISRSVLSQVRELINDMQSIRIDDEWNRVRKICRSAGIAFESKGDAGVFEGPPITRNILCLCMRECVTNVVKHSCADRCMVEIREQPESFLLQVEDDGIGMNIENIESFGSGIVGMKERLLLIGGKLEVNSESAAGTKVIVTVPKVKNPAKMEES
jgi:two-component system sensor histidine kinase DesK